MPWPSPQDYQEAVQNPAYAFSDPELRASSPFLNALGLPLPISGNFACVYKMKNHSRVIAVRCFLRVRLPPIFDHGSAILRWNLPPCAPRPRGPRAACR